MGVFGCFTHYRTPGRGQSRPESRSRRLRNAAERLVHNLRRAATIAMMEFSEAKRHLLAAEAERFASLLAEGAERASEPGHPLEVRCVRLPSSIRSWAGKQTTLMNHIRRGAYAVIRQTDGSRWLYTTSRGNAQVATLERWTVEPMTVFTGSDYHELRSRLELSLHEAMHHATSDGRSRRATTRGFDFRSAHEKRERERRFTEIADGSRRASEADIEDYLVWWQAQIDPRVVRMLAGLPVDLETFRAAERAGLVERFRLTTRTRP